MNTHILFLLCSFSISMYAMENDVTDEPVHDLLTYNQLAKKYFDAKVSCKQKITDPALNRRIWYLKYTAETKRDKQGKKLRDENGKTRKGKEKLGIGAQNDASTKIVFKKDINNEWVKDKTDVTTGNLWSYAQSPDGKECITGNTNSVMTVYVKRNEDGSRNVPDWSKRVLRIGQTMDRYYMIDPYIKDNEDYDAYEFKGVEEVAYDELGNEFMQTVRKEWDPLQTLSQKPGEMKYALYAQNNLFCGTQSNDIHIYIKGQDTFWEILKVLSTHTGPVITLALSHDENELASGSEDETVLVWDLTQLNRVNALAQIYKNHEESSVFTKLKSYIKKEIKTLKNDE